VIGRLEGILAEKAPEALVIDVGGVGYDVRVPLSTFLELPDPGKVVRLQIHTYVREDTLQLYGFLTAEERLGFRLLIGISGVGPRMALAILSGLPIERMLLAIRKKDLTSFTAVPGVGPKTAERILIELRDKVAEFELIEERSEGTADAEDATVSALVNLGYPRGHAEKAVRRALESVPDGEMELEDLIREALRVAAG
jgi:Holliday junction DNA helicase RuvA